MAGCCERSKHASDTLPSRRGAVRHQWRRSGRAAALRKRLQLWGHGGTHFSFSCPPRTKTLLQSHSQRPAMAGRCERSKHASDMLSSWRGAVRQQWRRSGRATAVRKRLQLWGHGGTHFSLSCPPPFCPFQNLERQRAPPVAASAAIWPAAAAGPAQNELGVWMHVRVSGPCCSSAFSDPGSVGGCKQTTSW